ncbi:hypothetical protein ACOSP7_022930 [Xanthoceras sorbifolium]
MGGRHQVSTITDQDLAMKGAIAKVLLDNHHCLCLWHIKKNFKMKKNAFISYEEKWKILVMENGLEKNEWLNHLYEIYDSWVFIYTGSKFFFKMNITKHSESINLFFDGFLTSKTNLREFVIKVEQAWKKIIENESYEDFESEHKYRIIDDGEFLLKHALQLFTKRVFNKFKDEWYQLNLQTYKDMCKCQTFEFVGILCRHFLKVFVRLNIDMIPNHFFRIMDSKDHLVKSDRKEESEALRLGHMCHQATKLACIAASSNEKYIIYMEALNELSTKFSEGRKKDVESSRRIKSSIEVALKKKKRTCTLCSNFGHDKPCLAKFLLWAFGFLKALPVKVIYYYSR